MIKPLSLQKKYTLIYSGDPALIPVPEKHDGQSDEDHAKLVEERARKLTVAQDTGDWSEMIQPGQHPTQFQMRQLTSSQFNWVHGTVRRLKLGELESSALLFRLALSQVDGLDGVRVIDREDFEGQKLVSVEVYDAVGFEVANEIANVVFKRCSTPVRPL